MGKFKRDALIIMFVVTCSLGWVTSIFAEEVGDAQLKGNVVRQTQQNSMNLEQTATMWGLTLNEYKQYLKEMKNTLSGHWWKHVDPPQVLGMNAKTETERMKYAHIDVQLDQARAGKEIAFQHAYDKAFAENYPNAKPIDINTDQEIRYGSVHSNDRFYLFTPLNDPEGALLANKIIQLMIDQSDVSLNIFFVGRASFDDIQRWAKGNNVSQSMRNGNQITLNHNQQSKSNMLQHVLKTTKVTLPILVRVRNQRSEVVSLTTL